jgi:hypothetical protein
MQFPLRVPNRDSRPRSADPQAFERTETLGNVRLDPLARILRIFYPAWRDVRPKLQVTVERRNLRLM